MMHGFTDVPVSTFFRLLQIVVHVATVWSWLNLTATLIWDCSFSPTVLWAVGILYPRRLRVHLQSTASRDIWILYDRRRWVSLWTPGPHKPIGCWLWCMFGDGLIWCFISAAAIPGELPGELSDRCPVCSVLSVSDVGVLWPNGWMDQNKTGPSSPPKRDTAQSPQSSAHVCCGQTVAHLSSQLLLSSCFHSSRQRVPVLCNGSPLAPQNCSFPWESGPHLIHGSFLVPSPRVNSLVRFH